MATAQENLMFSCLSYVSQKHVPCQSNDKCSSRRVRLQRLADMGSHMKEQILPMHHISHAFLQTMMEIKVGVSGACSLAQLMYASKHQSYFSLRV